MEKRLAKFKNCWMNDRAFRNIIYSGMRPENGKIFFIAYQNEYPDLHIGNMQIFDFINGFFNCAKVKGLDYYLLGQKLGLNGLIVGLIRCYFSDVKNINDINYFTNFTREKLGSQIDENGDDPAAFHLGTRNVGPSKNWNERWTMLNRIGSDLREEKTDSKFRQL